MRIAISATAVALVACGQPDEAVTRAEIENIRDRITQLEQEAVRPAEIQTAPEPERAAPATLPEQRMTHQLVGTSFQGGEVFRYPGLEACEQARQSLLDSWREDDERKRTQGVVFTSRPTPSCLPL
ncbi:hypothetical protein [Qipengyuania sp. SM2507]